MPATPRWTNPPPSWPSDVERWDAFCAEIDARIAAIREWDVAGHRRWPTFDPPLDPDVSGHPFLPIGPVVMRPTNVNTRDRLGRYARLRPLREDDHDGD